MAYLCCCKGVTSGGELPRTPLLGTWVNRGMRVEKSSPRRYCADRHTSYTCDKCPISQSLAREYGTYVDTVGLFISDTAYSPGGSPTAFWRTQAMSMHPQPIGLVPRYRPCGQSCLPQRKPLHADERRAWHHLRR